MIEEGIRCQSQLHHSEKVDFILIQVRVRQGAMNRWIEQYWCQRCLEEQRIRGTG